MLLRLLDNIPWEGQLPATWFEELLALCLDDPTLPDLVLQHPIRDASGRVVARADIAFPSVRLGLEAHSREFHFGPIAEPLDEDRDIAAGLCGWELTYLGWYATKRPAWNATWFMPGRRRECSMSGTMSGDCSTTTYVGPSRHERPYSHDWNGS